MTKTDTALVKDAEQFFLATMRKRYNDELLVSVGFDMPYSLTAPNVDGPWEFRETWTKLAAGPDFGTMAIFRDNRPYWYLQYHGQRSPNMDAFIGEARLNNYQSGLFFSGRGPRFERDDPTTPGMRLVYVNIIDKHDCRSGSFARFSVRELIHTSISDLKQYNPETAPSAPIISTYFHSGGLL